MVGRLFKTTKYGKYRLYEVPVRQGEHIAEVFLRGPTAEACKAQALQYLALFSAAPKLLSVAKLALSSASHSNHDWELRVKALLQDAIAEAEDHGS